VQFREALRRSLTVEGPFLVDAVVDKEAIGPVTRYDAVRMRPL
jgi:thiamine pyrophosphate-dependent acetolactate synthase large subunit-like protein